MAYHEFLVLFTLMGMHSVSVSIFRQNLSYINVFCWFMFAILICSRTVFVALVIS